MFCLAPQKQERVSILQYYAARMWEVKLTLVGKRCQTYVHQSSKMCYHFYEHPIFFSKYSGWSSTSKVCQNTSAIFFLISQLVATEPHLFWRQILVHTGTHHYQWHFYSRKDTINKSNFYNNSATIIESTPQCSCPLPPNTNLISYLITVLIEQTNLVGREDRSCKRHPNRTNPSPADLSFDILTERSHELFSTSYRLYQERNRSRHYIRCS